MMMKKWQSTRKSAKSLGSRMMGTSWAWWPLWYWLSSRDALTYVSRVYLELARPALLQHSLQGWWSWSQPWIWWWWQNCRPSPVSATARHGICTCWEDRGLSGNQKRGITPNYPWCWTSETKWCTKREEAPHRMRRWLSTGISATVQSGEGLDLNSPPCVIRWGAAVWKYWWTHDPCQDHSSLPSTMVWWP